MAAQAAQAWLGGSFGGGRVRHEALSGTNAAFLLPQPPLQQHLSQQALRQRTQRHHTFQGSRRRHLGCLVRAQQQPQRPRSESPPARPAVSAARVRLTAAPAAAAAAAAALGAGAYAPSVTLVGAPPANAPQGSDGSSSGGGSQPEPKEEPEVVLLIIACLIGVASGGAIVAFNIGVHFIRDVIWENQSLLASNRELLRNISESDLWPKVVFPPFFGGLAVGALGLAIGGYDEKPAPKVPGGVSGSSGSSGSGSSGGSVSEGDGDAARQALAAGTPAGGLAAAGSSSSGGSSSGGSSSTSSGSGGMGVLYKWREQAGPVLRPVSRALAAAITLGTGASLGPEGPSVDIGKSTASGLSSTLRSRQRHLTSLMAAGAGAGVAAGFNAPVAGVFFAVETVLQKQQLPRIRVGSDPAAAQLQLQEASRALSPSALTIAMVLLAAVLAAVVSQAGLGSSPAFRVPEYRLESLYELPLYLVFGAVCGVVSASCSFSTKVAINAFDELREQNSIEAALLPCIGGLTTGVLALGYPEILYQGFDNVNNILSSSGAYAPGLLVQIVVMKVIATSICRGSGLQGGLYAPSIFIGAALGSAFGLMAHAVGDPLGLPLSAPQAYALVGVAAMLASNCSVPLTSVLLLFELTRDYLIILPTLAAVGISFWISSLAAPSVKNAAAARRMSAAAAASAAVATTRLSTAATEAVLVGNLQGRRAGTAAAAAGLLPAGQPSGATRSELGLALSLSPELASSGSSGGIAYASGSFDGFDRALLAPPALAAAAARAGERRLPVSAALERSCLLVESDMSLSRALELMQADDQNVAVVLGEDGGVMGLVSRDVLEQCVAAAADVQAAAAAQVPAAQAFTWPSSPWPRTWPSSPWPRSAAPAAGRSSAGASVEEGGDAEPPRGDDSSR